MLPFNITSKKMFSVITKGPVAGMVSPSFPDDLEYASTMTSDFLSSVGRLYADKEQVWIPPHRLYEYKRDDGHGKTTPMIGVTIALTSGSEDSLVILVERLFDDNYLQVTAKPSPVMLDPEEITDQMKAKIRDTNQQNKADGKPYLTQKEEDRAVDNVALRRVAEYAKMTEETNKYTTNQHKPIFKLPLPCEVKDEITYKKIHIVHGAFGLVIELECVVHDTYTAPLVAKASPAKP